MGRCGRALAQFQSCLMRFELSYAIRCFLFAATQGGRYSRRRVSRHAVLFWLRGRFVAVAAARRVLPECFGGMGALRRNLGETQCL